MSKGTEMTRMIFGCILACAVVFGAGCQESAKKATTSTVGSGEVREYEVFGMDCPGCQSGLEKLVNKIPAVQQSSANWKEKRLAVTVKEGAALNDEDVYDAIRRANFTVGKRIK